MKGASAEHRKALHAVYAAVDLLLADHSCEASTECCRFGITGREPYLTALEAEDVKRIQRSENIRIQPPPRGGRLPVLTEAAAERVCPFLSGAGRCRIYAQRPFGCRTFFCEKRVGPKKYPRDQIRALLRQIEDLSEAAHPGKGPRTLTSVLGTGT